MLQINVPTVKAGNLEIKACFMHEGEYFMAVNATAQIKAVDPDFIHVLCFNTGLIGKMHKAVDVVQIKASLEIK